MPTSTQKPLDLWTTTLPMDRLYPHFRALAAMPTDRECFQRWADGFADVNGNIVDVFQTQFSPAFWEIYLYKFFQRLGFQVERPPQRPDYVLATPQGTIVAEATTINPCGPSFVSTPIHDTPFDREAFYDQTSARLMGSLQRKLDAYRLYAEEREVEGRPFLLCINPYDNPHFVVQGFGAITRVLYQYCDPRFVYGASGQMIEVAHRRVESFQTRNGANVSLGFFLDPRNVEVGGVFFNPRATLGKLFADPQRNGHEQERVFAEWYMVGTGTCQVQDVHPRNYRETLGDGGYLLLNPYARHEIDPEPFFQNGVAVCHFDVASRRLVTRTPTPFLKSRIPIGVIPAEYPPDLLVRGRPCYDIEGHAS